MGGMYGPNDILGATGNGTGGCMGMLLCLIVVGAGLAAGIVGLCCML